MDVDSRYVIRDASELAGLYGPALERSLRKQIDHLDDYCRAFIAASPFVIIGTQNETAADASPRGDVPGFVKVLLVRAPPGFGLAVAKPGGTKKIETHPI